MASRSSLCFVADLDGMGLLLSNNGLRLPSDIGFNPRPFLITYVTDCLGRARAGALTRQQPLITWSNQRRIHPKRHRGKQIPE
jgi:hypothetical protein